jgi:hypothetical protein
MCHPFDMGKPDLTLEGLSIWVLDRQLPDATDYWDANWLTVRATMHVGHSSVTTEGSIFMTADFERFGEELASLHTKLVGEASLSSYEPNLKVTLRAGRTGHIDGEVEITPDQLSEFHRFDVAFDQTYLPALITSCETIVQRFPVIGRSDP